MSQVSVDSTDPPEPGGSAEGLGTVERPGSAQRPETDEGIPERGRTGPVELVMSTLIRKLSWSRLSQPKVAIAVSGVGLLLSIIVGATAPNHETLPLKLPLSTILPSLGNHIVLASALLYAGNILACLGLAGMLWAHSQGWRPDPRRLLIVSGFIIAVMVSLTPVGSSDTASYAAYGRIANLGKNPYTSSPAHVLGHASQYFAAIGSLWKNTPSVYGPVATVVQRFAAWIGGADAATTIWILMILNGLVFIGVGVLLMKTSDDPVRATLFWTANPVLIQQLVSGGHLDTFVAAAAICAIQVARKVSGKWGDVLIGVLIGLACGVKATAALIGLGLAWPLLLRREWMRTARIAVVSLITIAVLYSFYVLSSLKPLIGADKLVTLPSPWWFLAKAFGGISPSGTPNQPVVATIISIGWPIAMILVAMLIYKRISDDQPREVVAPFALAFAWILVFPWVFPWYTAIAWVTLTQVPRNRMTRWLAIVTVVLAVWHSSGGQPPATPASPVLVPTTSHALIRPAGLSVRAARPARGPTPQLAAPAR